ncbi:MAG: YdbH domain-containing protein [Alphaproteobacteria bacterium]|nr:YdbH domain-containing protein [Alphaproteobacteria bacterium]
MNTMRRVRLFFGVFASVAFLALALWFGLQKLVEREITLTAIRNGLQIASIQSIRPLFFGVSLHKIKLMSENHQKNILIDTVNVHFTLKSILQRIAQHITIKGLQFRGNLDDVKNFLYTTSHYGNTSFFDTCHLSGFLNLHDAYDQGYFIPLDVTLSHHFDRMGIGAELRLLTQGFSTDMTIHLDKDNKDLKTDISCHNMMVKRAGFDFSADTLSLSTTPMASSLHNARAMMVKLKGQNIAFDLLHLSKKEKSTVHFDLKSTIDASESLLKIQGDGQINLDEESAQIILETVDDGVSLDIQAKKLKAASFLKLLNHFSGHGFEAIKGEAQIQASAHFPLRLTEEKRKDFLPSFFSIFLELMDQKENKGFVNIALKDISVHHPLYAVDSLNTSLEFKLFPLQTQGKQTIQATSARFSKLHLDKPHLDFTLKDTFKIQEFVTHMLGGSMRLHSFDMKDISDMLFLFDSDGIDLLDTLTLLEIKGLSGGGKMGGHGQIHFKQDRGLKIKNAKFFSTSRTGKIHYTPESTKDLEEDQVEVDAKTMDAKSTQVMEILKNITFSSLTAEFLPVDGRLQGLVEIYGYTDFMNGYPCHLKIKTSGDLEETIQSSLDFFKLNENWDKVKSDLKKVGQNNAH